MKPTISEIHEERSQVIERLRQWWRENGIVAAAYFLATIFTDAHFTGDTSDYADSIVAYEQGRYYEFWEFGHVLWRPLGWSLLKVAGPVINRFWGGDVKTSTTIVLSTTSWLAGLMTVFVIAAILRRFCARPWIVNATVLALITAHGFLNFAQTGTAYLPSLSLMILAVYVLLRKDKGQQLSLSDGMIVGVLVALMLCFWLPFVTVVPAILAVPLVLSKPDKMKVRASLGAAIMAAVLVGVVYFAVALGPVGVRNIGDFRAWMLQTSGRTAQDKGLARTVLGFPRSFIYMGNDGMTFKRYLVRDPFNPVTVFDLLRLSLWKLMLFYLFFASLILNLWRSAEGKRLLLILVLTAFPVIGFGLYWHGGDIERYLALYPIVFLAFGFSLCCNRSSRALNYVALLFVTVAAITNLTAMATPVLNRKQERAAARIGELTPNLNASSQVFVVNFQDEMYTFNRDFPSNPIVRSRVLNVISLVEVGGKTAVDWRRDFARSALRTWSQGGDVWVTRRVLVTRPQPDWNWVEGDDKRLSWTDFFNFFSQVEFGESVGAEDGFVWVRPSESNRRFFDQLSK